MSTLKKFINVTDAVIRTIIRLCPEENSIKVGYEYFSLGRSASPKKLWYLFMKQVYPMKEMILNRDEKFFLNNTVDKEALEENVSAQVGGDNAFQSIMNIKDAWTSRITDNEKEKIWNALKVLITLSDTLIQEEIKLSDK